LGKAYTYLRMTKDNKESAALESVTDYHEEEEIDAQKAASVLQEVDETDAGERKAAALREVELAKIKVSQSDVDFLVTEWEISAKVADRALRENENDVIKTCQAMLSKRPRPENIIE